LGVALPLVVAIPQTVGQGSSSGAACVEVGALSVWGTIGFNHFVFLTNRCPETYACAVSTNVNPEPLQATVPGHSTVEVITALNSPERGFVPIVSCEPATPR